MTGGQTATLAVAATGTPAPTFQWCREGVAIPVATAATLSLSNAQAFDAGSYTVVVTNAAGSVTSDAVTVTVNISRLINLSILTSLDTAGAR